jgi:hypothetical protein
MENKKLTGYPSIDKPWLKYYSGGKVDIKKLESKALKLSKKNA